MTSATLNAIALVSLGIGLQACGTTLFADRPSEGVPNQSLMALPIEVSAQNIEDALAQAADLRRAGEYDRAGNVLTRIVAAFPSNSEAIGEYGKLLLAQGRGEESLPFLSRAIQLRPDDWTLLSAQGIALDQLGRHDAALRSYEAALELSPNEGAVLTNAGLSRMQAGDLNSAEDFLTRALERAPNPGTAGLLADVRARREAGQAGAVTQDVTASRVSASVEPEFVPGTVSQTATQDAPAPRVRARQLPEVASEAEAPAGGPPETSQPTGAPRPLSNLEALANDPTVVMQRLPEADAL